MTTTETNTLQIHLINDCKIKNIISQQPPAELSPYGSNSSSSSNSTTTTNSPILSTNHLLDPISVTTCHCQKLITTDNCNHCSNNPSLPKFSNEYNNTKAQLNELKVKTKSLRHDDKENSHKIDQITKNLAEKHQDIKTTTEKIESLKHDIGILKIKCKEETCQVEDIQRSKQDVKKELEDLSTKLFEEATLMVNMEKAEQAELRKKNNLLQGDIKSAEIELVAVQEQLDLLRNEFATQQATSNGGTGISSKIPNIDMNGSFLSVEEQEQEQCNNIDTYTRAQVETILMYGLDLGVHMDTLEDDSALMDFNDFIQLLYKTPLRKVHSIKYMRYLLRDDIEPCLRFGPNPKISSKKITEAALVKSCFVEECPPGFVHEQATRQLKEEATATLWERFTTSSVFLGCQACGRNSTVSEREATLKYRFRISYFDEWACIDRYCRDRLLAVVEYYTFIRHLRAGLYKHRSLHELYQQSMRLKLQMFIARTGTLPHMLKNCGIESNKIATAFYGEDIHSSIVLLSESTMERLSSSTTDSAITISTVESSSRTSTVSSVSNSTTCS